MSTLGRHDVVIVGAGHGGAQVAISLRQRQFAGSVAMIGDEPHWPYERPPLTKEYLHGIRAFERMLLRPESFWHKSAISVRLGSPAVEVDPIERVVTLASGESVHYGTLVWAAGGKPRTLTCPGAHLKGVHTLRSRGDVDALRQELSSVSRVAIVGGGYLGLEAAATLSQLGKRVTILEALDRVLARVTVDPLSRFIEAVHRAHGVDIHFGARIESVEPVGACVGAIRVEGGAVIPADLVIAAIGISPVVEPLLVAGAQGGNGVLVNEFGQTSLPNIYAIGDCALHANDYADGSTVRLESVQNASDMAVTVAKALTGEMHPYRAVPWFWSNQYDLRLQIAGLSSNHDDLTVRGDITSRSFSVIYRRRGRVIALDCVNAPKDFVQGRGLVQKGARAEQGALADTTVALKDLK
jgi:3-phenylpropionate/trans-cinnamate dioxygenase ferredoxin reductase subunit